MRRLIPSGVLRAGVFSGLLLASLALGGCRHDEYVKVDMEDPDSPKYKYMAHEFALLQLAVDDIQGLEKKRQYGKIYDDYASPEFVKYVSRRQFLIMSNCTEQNLGSVIEFEDDNLSFNRNREPEKGQPAIDSITRQVRRKHGLMREQLVFTSDGVKFRLNGLYWIADDKRFLKCIKEAQKASPLPPAPTPPEPLKPEDEEKPGQKPKADDKKDAGEPKKPENQTPENGQKPTDPPETPPVETPKTQPSTEFPIAPAPANPLAPQTAPQ